MNLFTLAIRNLQRRLPRSIVVSASVGLAVGSALSLLALADSIEHGVREGADERSSDLMILQRNASDIFSGFISEDTKDRLIKLRGVEDVTGELIMFAPIDGSQQKLVAGWSPDGFLARRMPIMSGRAPQPAELRAAVLGAGAAETLHKGIGDDLDILNDRFRVVGIVNYQSAINRSMIFVSLADLQDVAFRTGQVTLFHVRLSPSLTPAEIETVKTEINRIGPLLVTPTDQLLRNDRNLTIMRTISRTVSVIALTMGALGVLNALLMAVQERTVEIGIMMAIGWTKTRTMSSIVVEGLLVGVAGCLVGVVIAFGFSFLLTSMPIVGEFLSFLPTPQTVLPIIVGAILLSVIGSLYPAWRAASTKPADALRRT